MNYEDTRERFRQLCQQVLAELGLKDPLVILESLVGDPFDLTVEYAGDLNFEILANISETFGTRDINLSCDLGCSSDRSHDKTIYIKGAHPPKSS